MKYYCPIVFIISCLIQQILPAQTNNYFLPPVLHGPVYNLNMQNGTYQFNPGITSQTKGFNGNLLGPTLILQKGQRVTMNVTNSIGEETTVHWHGLHVSPENDGGPHSVIDPNTTWSPEFTVLDKAATYWYHPHAHELTAKHLLQGLAGLIIVKDEEEASFNLPRTYGVDDFPLIIQTKAISSTGEIFYAGREANLDDQLMVNGVKNSQLTVPRQMVRLRILNGSNQRVFNLGLNDSSFFYHIATDGGLKNISFETRRLLLAPGERAEIIIPFNSYAVGTNLELMSFGDELPYGYWGGRYPWINSNPNGIPPNYNPNFMNDTAFTILRFAVTGATANPVMEAPPLVLASDIRMRRQEAIKTREKWLFSGGGHTSVGVTIGNTPVYDESTPFHMNIINDSIPFNNIEIWTLHGADDQYHPFHIHDVQFYILSRTDEFGRSKALSSNDLGRKDVVHVGPRETVEIIMKFDDFRSEVPYVYHCHIPVHEDKGMMKQFIVHTQGLYVDKNYDHFIQLGTRDHPYPKLRTAVDNAFYSAIINFLSSGTHEEVSSSSLLIRKRITLKPTAGKVIIQ